MKVTVAVPGILGAVLGLIWGGVLIFVTWVIYDDGEFTDPHWIAVHTGLVISGSVLGSLGLIVLLLKRIRLSAFLLLSAAFLVLGAIAPGYAFAWTGFSGFGTTFFGIFILLPSLLLSALLLTSGLLLLRGALSPLP